MPRGRARVTHKKKKGAKVKRKRTDEFGVEEVRVKERLTGKRESQFEQDRAKRRAKRRAYLDARAAAEQRRQPIRWRDDYEQMRARAAEMTRGAVLAKYGVSGDSPAGAEAGSERSDESEASDSDDQDDGDAAAFKKLMRGLERAVPEVAQGDLLRQQRAEAEGDDAIDDVLLGLGAGASSSDSDSDSDSDSASDAEAEAEAEADPDEPDQQQDYDHAYHAHFQSDVREKPAPAAAEATPQSFAEQLKSFKDVAFLSRTPANGGELRAAYARHAVQLVNAAQRLQQRNDAAARDTAVDDDDALEQLRDRGFTRPRVLVLLPFRKAGRLFVEALLAAAQAEARASDVQRLADEFGDPEVEDDGGAVAQRPADWREVFDGNIHDDFKMGISLARGGRSVRLFSDFYRSDVLLASPLALRILVGAPGDKQRDFDFLSSVEMVVVDQADVVLEQNWEHLWTLFEALNCQPAKQYDAEIDRLRRSALDGAAKCFRQTVLLAAHRDAEFNVLRKRLCHNCAGAVELARAGYRGSISRVVPQIKQVFSRLPPHAVDQRAEARLAFFEDNVLPTLTGRDHVLLFIPSYLDFVHVRNLLIRKEVRGVRTMTEYSRPAEVSRARSDLFHGRSRITLYTGRHHFYKRYRVRGVRHLVFYAPPAHAAFYPEMLNVVEDPATATVLTLYSRFDSFALERIVGTDRAGKMVAGESTSYMFV